MLCLSSYLLTSLQVMISGIHVSCWPRMYGTYPDQVGDSGIVLTPALVTPWSAR